MNPAELNRCTRAQRDQIRAYRLESGGGPVSTPRPRRPKYDGHRSTLLPNGEVLVGRIRKRDRSLELIWIYPDGSRKALKRYRLARRGAGLKYLAVEAPDQPRVGSLSPRTLLFGGEFAVLTDAQDAAKTFGLHRIAVVEDVPAGSVPHFGAMTSRRTVEIRDLDGEVIG